jgi:hypothetical protein
MENAANLAAAEPAPLMLTAWWRSGDVGVVVIECVTANASIAGMG